MTDDNSQSEEAGVDRTGVARERREIREEAQKREAERGITRSEVREEEAAETASPDDHRDEAPHNS